MLHNVTFHQRLHCLLSQKLSSVKEIQSYLVIKTCDPSTHTIDHSEFTVSDQKEESVSA